MSTFEGPLMSIKAVNSLSHYTDWTIGHVHSGALGWVGYDLLRRDLLPRAVAVEPKQPVLARLVNWHFWLATHRHRSLHHRDVGVGHHAGPDVARLRCLGFLEYSFVETVEAMHPFYVIRALGGALFVVGALIMAYNLWMTIRHGEAAPEAEANRQRRPGSRPNKGRD
jgi:cytochrome c oxidase cbb3-type subunit 1